MAIYFGSDKIGEIYVGSDKIKEVYHGSDLVFGGGLGPMPSYIITTGGTRIDFDLDNTPLSNLSTTGAASSSITVNNQSVIKNTIKEIYFGDSYKNVTSIGSNFLRYCKGLTSVDLSPLSNVTSIGDYFLTRCTNLTSVDLSELTSITSIGVYFLYLMVTLSEVKMGAINPPTLGIYAFWNIVVQSIKVPSQSVDDYKTATNWSSKASIITGY